MAAWQGKIFLGMIIANGLFLAGRPCLPFLLRGCVGTCAWRQSIGFVREGEEKDTSWAGRCDGDVRHDADGDA